MFYLHSIWASTVDEYAGRGCLAAKSSALSSNSSENEYFIGSDIFIYIYISIEIQYADFSNGLKFG